MNWRREFPVIFLSIGTFLVFYLLPGGDGFLRATNQGVLLLHDYAKEHVIFCLIPAFFIAGAIEVFVSDESILKFLGPKAPKFASYGVAAVSGTILAVCSCTILPLFAGIYNMGAGIGPATTFLYSGPAINILAIILSARVLGFDIGLGRAIGAIVASLFVGLSMAALFRESDKKRVGQISCPDNLKTPPIFETVAVIATLVLILIFATWGNGTGGWNDIFKIKWYITGGLGILLGIELSLFHGIRSLFLIIVGIVVAFVAYFTNSPELSFGIGTIGLSIVLYFAGGLPRQWFESSYILARKILPLLFLGVFFAGFFLGRPGDDAGIISKEYVASLVGTNSLFSNLFASVMGALMYFATLSEVPIIQGLLHSGMAVGPALALLLAGPAVSLPNMMVIRSVMGSQKTIAYLILVIVFATITGEIFGGLFS